MRFRTALFLPPLISVLAGCGTQTVLVEPGTPVRLAEDVPAARVYVPDSAGHWIEGAKPVRLPAGWYVLPPPTTRPATQASTTAR